MATNASLQEYRDFTYLTQVSLEFALRATGVQPSENISKPLFDHVPAKAIVIGAGEAEEQGVADDRDWRCFSPWSEQS